VSPAKRSGAKRSAKKATKKAARKAAVVSIPSPVEVLGEVGAGLDERERRFAYAYAADPNASKAYRVISPDVTPTTARCEGMRMKRRPDVAEFITTLQKELLEQFDATAERTVEELAFRVFLDPAELHDENGVLLPLHKMPAHVRRAIGGIKYKNGLPSEVKLVDHSVELLMKYHKLLVDRTEHDVTPRLAELMRAAEERVQHG
jgi:hypothetical protein